MGRASQKKRARKKAPTPHPAAKRPPLSAGKRAAFLAVTLVLFFGCLELALALFGVRPVTVERDPYVGFASQLKLYEPAGGGELRTARNKLSLFNDQTFPAEKPRGSFRIFTLGGSSTYGRPFDDATSFSGWLRTYLAGAVPGRRFEVINAGGISYASYRVAQLMEELAEHEPDLFVIYSGHNEFLERRTYSGLIAEPEALTRTKLLLQKSRLWALGRAAVEHRQRAARESYQLTGEVQELLDTSAGLGYYFRDEPFERQVLDHYRYNLQRMIRLARGAGARVILVTVPVNAKDFSPFKSQHSEDLAETERQHHIRLLADADAALAAGHAEDARRLAAEAVGVDALHAGAHFLHGRALQALGRYDEAGQAFGRAVEEDVCPLRALAETNASIAEAAQRDGVPLVDYRGLLEQHVRSVAGHGNLGDEVFLDHAHPTVEAHGILARALLEEMAALGVLELPADWPSRFGDRVEREVLARVDAEAQARAYKNLSKVLIWAGKKQEAEKYVRLASEVLGGDWELRYNAGMVHLDAGRSEAAVASFLEAAELDPERAMIHDQLGVAYAAAGRLDEAVAAGEDAVRLDPEMAGAWNNLAASFGERGEAERAFEATLRAIELEPGFAEAHNHLGKLHFDRGELEEALASYGRAVEHKPGYAEAHLNRGLVLGQLGRLEQALEAFEAARAIAPRLPGVQFGRGKALHALGDHDTAIAALEAAIGLPAHPAEAHQELTDALLSASRPEEAWQALRAGLAEHPEAAPLHRVHGRFLAQEGHFEDAAGAFAHAFELDPAFLPARVDLGNLRMVQGRHRDAIGVFREALEHHPDDDRLHHVLASALLISGDLETGRRHLELALAANPQNAAATQDLARVFEQLRQPDRALELYRQAARLDPRLADDRKQAESRLGGGR